METKNIQHPDGQIQLLNGTILDCYPREKPAEKVDNQLTSEQICENLGLIRPKSKVLDNKLKQICEQAFAIFTNNAFLFLENRDRIFSDSRMFLAPVPIKNGVSIFGYSGFLKPTLGVFLEWWLQSRWAAFTDKKGHWLVYEFSGSILSGCNTSYAVGDHCTTTEFNSPSFSDLWINFKQVNTRYDSAKSRYQAYTISEVAEVLKSEGRAVDQQSVEEFFLKKEIARQRRILKSFEEEAKDIYKHTFNELDEQYEDLTNSLKFNNYRPMSFSIDVADFSKPLASIMPNNTDKEKYIKFLRYASNCLESAIEQLTGREAQRVKAKKIKAMKKAESELADFYIEYKKRQKEIEALDAWTKEYHADLRRKLKAGSIGNKGYQYLWTPAHKKVEAKKVDLDFFVDNTLEKLFKDIQVKIADVEEFMVGK